jgi:hypothetical protein
VEREPDDLWKTTLETCRSAINADWREADGARKIGRATALGPAYRAGLRAGFFPEPDRFGSLWQSERRFTPQMDAAMREQRLAGWASAIRRLLA